ncbi:MAG: hydrolase [Actinophytocola sp.]|nr:hydrolase [Actinophytocola sp.]
MAATGTAVAVPPPPPNPSDSEISESREEARERAGQVGQLTNRLAKAEGRLSSLRDEVARKLELANKARVDAEAADAVAKQAKRDAETARRESGAASDAITAAQDKMDEFVAGSFQQGSEMGSVSAYVTSDNPKDVMLRAQMLDAVSKGHLNAMEALRQARVEKSNADAAARKAVTVAEEKKREAEEAKRSAASAHETASAAQRSQAKQTKTLEADRDGVQRELYAAQKKVKGLEGQRDRYQDWLAAKRREEALKAKKAAMAAANNTSNSGGGNSAPAPSGSSVETVVSRAMSQLGVQYAWGGGNTQGPTYGIRDGGVADSYGDYNKIGFDCSGLMIYAFAGVKTLPHYSGYQYDSGRKVPLSQMRRGDMLFWGTSGIHHVAMYLGNGQMIEAPQSGLRVRVVPVRYGDILPYATRLIG